MNTTHGEGQIFLSILWNDLYFSRRKFIKLLYNKIRIIITQAMEKRFISGGLLARVKLQVEHNVYLNFPDKW